MKIQMYHIDDVDAFMNIVDQCSGDVYIVSKFGDLLNLKSKLTQYIALSKLFGSPDINGLELSVSDPEDAEKLINLMMSGN